MVKWRNIFLIAFAYRKNVRVEGEEMKKKVFSLIFLFCVLFLFQVFACALLIQVGFMEKKLKKMYC